MVHGIFPWQTQIIIKPGACSARISKVSFINLPSAVIQSDVETVHPSDRNRVVRRSKSRDILCLISEDRPEHLN